MRTVLLYIVVCWLAILAGCATTEQAADKKKGEKLQYVETDTGRWLIHDTNRPAPAIITPGTSSTQSEPGEAPSDAIILFDGIDLLEWTSRDGKSPAKWVVRDGYMEAVKRSGPVKTKQKFGSCQLHIEFATPSTVRGSGQGRGNSGVFLMDTYEVQIPYDIIFHRPIFKGKKVVKKATFTVFHNGVPVHDHVVLQGGTDWRGKHAVSDYEPHEDKLPIMLQDHGNPVRFRNIWIRELAD